MKASLIRAATAALLVVGFHGVDAAAGDCGMNSNKPCPPPGQTTAKEPAYKSMNSNKPASRAAAPKTVQANPPAGTPAKATLTGVSPSDLKVKPRPASTIG
ncbi:hypothetical protein [Thermomonas sp.]|uniref:hypothetical protein n=1 Tax=Thermomonas sp. TaxID=1971895 RepID=UPI00391BA043